MELNVINSSTSASVASWANGLIDPPRAESRRQQKALRCGREYSSAEPEIRRQLSVLTARVPDYAWPPLRCQTEGTGRLHPNDHLPKEDLGWP